MRSVSPVLWALLLLVFFSAVATAQTSAVAPSVGTTVDPCVPVNEAVFRRILGIELGASIDAQLQGGERPGGTHVYLSCVADGVQLKLEDGVTRKSMMRVLDLDSIEAGSRTRLLALAVAEFVVASWMELTLQPEPSVPPAAPPPPPELRAQAQQTVRRKQPDALPPPSSGESGLDLNVSGTVEGWTSLGRALPGFGLRIVHQPLPHFAWSLGGDFAYNKLPVAAVGYAELASMSAAGVLMAHWRLHAWQVMGGVGGRLGMARVTGIPNNPNSVRGESFFAPWGGPLMLLRGVWAPLGALRLGLEFEVGVATLPARALVGQVVVLELDGAWFKGALSVGVGF